MANLLDTIRTNNPANQQQGVTDETSKLQALLRAKSGKAVGDSGVAASNLGEQSAVAGANQQMQNQVAPQVQIQQAGQQQQQAQQQQTEKLQTQEIEQQRKFDTIQNKMKTNQMLSDFERSKGTIDLARDKSSLEQLGFQLRLQDKSYLDNLQREGSARRLGDQQDFNQAMAESVLGDNQEVLEKNLGNKSILDADDREFKKSLANMDAADAYKMFKKDQKAAKDRALWSALGAGTQAGGSMAGSMGGGASKAPATNTGTTVATGDISTGDAGNVT